jgi:mycothiol synthase
MIRRAGSDADLAMHVRVWNTVRPDAPATSELVRERWDREPQRLYLVAEDEGQAIGAGIMAPSDSDGRAFVAPCVLPAARRRGVGSQLLRELVAHAERHGYRWASSHVDGADAGSLAFARRFGFEEADRQVEQVVTLNGEERAPPPVPEGLHVVSVAERPHLLRESYELAVVGYADLATTVPVSISLDTWLREEATEPGGSFAALAGDEVVGYSGLVAAPDGTYEDGLTVVHRRWRRRGLATLLKRTKLAWAAANGIDEIVTWTQRGNDGMRAVNEQLGYEYRSVSITVRSPLPLLVP